MDSCLYQAGFERAQLPFYFHEEWQSKIDQLISLIKAGDIENGAASIWAGLLQDLERAQIQQAVIACTDINAVLPYAQTEINFIDSTEALAIATVKKYMEDGG